MSNDKEKQIEEMAGIILQGEIDEEQGKMDLSMYTVMNYIKFGRQRLAAATALYNAGYRKVEENKQ